MVKVAIDDSDDSKPRPAPRRKSRWKLKLFLFVASGIATAPSLVSMTGQVPVILKKLHPQLAEAVSFDSITLHWWAPVEVRGLRVRDLSEVEAGNSELTPIARQGAARQGDTKRRDLMTATKIVTAEPLWRILLNSGRGTGIVVTAPRLELTTDERGSNLERTLTHVFGESSPDSSGQFPLRVTVTDGHVRVQSFSDATTVSATSGGDDDTSRLKSSVVELTEINGSLSTMNVSRWLPLVDLSAEIRSPAATTDRQRSERAASTRPARLAAGLDEVTSDFPNVPLDQLAGASPEGDPTAARIQIRLNPQADDKGRQTIQLGARGLDLRLIQPLLDLSNIRLLVEGTLSGGVDARLAGANLTDGIAARLLLAGDRIRVRQPNWAAGEWLTLGNVDGSGAVAIAEDGMLVQDLKFVSDVGRLEGAGELRNTRPRGAQPPADAGRSPDAARQVEITGSVDLARLTGALRHTLALHDDVAITRGLLTFGLRGSAESDATNDSGRWQFTSKLDELQATRGGQPIVIDSQTQLDATGDFRDAQPQLNRAQLTADFGTVDCAPDGSDWLISGNVQPEKLWQLLRQFADLPQPGLLNDLAFQSRVGLDAEAIQLTDLQLNSTDVRLSSASLSISPANPLMSMLDGAVHLEGSGAAVRTLLAPWHDASWLARQAIVTGDMSAAPQKDLRLSLRLKPGTVATVARPGVRSVSNGRTITQTVSADSSLAIDEAEIDLALQATAGGRQFQITEGTIKLPGLNALVTGSVQVPDESLILDLTADTTYDLDVLSRRWFTADSGVLLSGQGRDTFRLTGSPTALAGSGIVNWHSANILGLQLGAAAVNAAIENNVLRADPIHCTLNGGELNVMPLYDLTSSRLELGTGSRVQNVQLTPELCQTWLGYVAPMLADSANVSGTISARVERFVWDLNDANRSDVSGQLTIHQASAAPGPSLLPLLEVAELLRRRGANNEPLSERALTFPEQTIPVQVRQGAVIHDGLVMDLAGYRLKSSGAVGLNQQLQLTLDVPLDKSSPTGTARSVKVPLRGTVKSPQPDTSGLLQSLGTQKLQEKIGEQLDQKLNKGLNGFLDKL